MLTTLKIVIHEFVIHGDYDSKHTFEIVYINKRYLVKQHYFYGNSEKTEQEKNVTYTIKQKNTLIEIIKSKMSFDTSQIDFDISKAECDIISDYLFEEAQDEEIRSKTLRKFLNILDNIEHDENELKKILIINTKNTITSSLPPELTEMILKNI